MALLRDWRRLPAPSRWGLVALLAFLLVARLYFWRLDGYLINDDEGSYLYAAWRISLGELPYRDFLTPQLPAFLMPGGWLMRLVGPQVWPARALAAGLTLGAGVMSYLTLRRLFGAGVAVLGAAALLLQPEVFRHGRTFRSDPFMFFFAGVGLWAFARGALPRPADVDPPRRRWLAAAGAAFGLATLCKLFGPLPLAGCCLWLALDGWQRRRPWRAVAGDLAAALLPCLVVVALGLGVFALTSDQVYAAVVGHHVRQNADQSLAQTLSGGLAFFGHLMRQPGMALLAFPALAMGLAALRSRDRPLGLLAAQLPTALAFLVLSREKYPRHLMYLVPALGGLFAAGVFRLARPARPPREATAEPAAGAWEREALAAALALALLLPWRLANRDQAYGREIGTRGLADLAALLTAPDELLLSDYSELNFYAGRPTTYSAASLSAGAAGSEQITWRLIQRELAGRLPPLVILDTDPEYAHTRFFKPPDRRAFEAWLAEGYGPAAGTYRRDHQVFEVYAPKDRPLPLRAAFGGGPDLLAAAADRADTASGDVVTVRTAWRAPEAGAGEEDLGLTLRLIGEDGLEWAQADGGLFASDPSDRRLRRRGTSLWQPGELVGARGAITVPLGLPAGEYDLLLGVYAPGGEAGLDATGADGAPLGQSLQVARLRVAPWAARPGDIPGELLDLDLRGEGAGAAGWAPFAPRLLGRGPLPLEPVPAGAAVPLDLWWAIPAGPPASDAPASEARLTLGEATSASVAADWAVDLPAGGAADAVVRLRTRLPIDPSAPAGRYALTARLNADASKVTALGELDVAARDLSDRLFQLPEGRPFQPMDMRFGGVARLLGADVGDWSAGVDVTLYWRAEGPAPADYQATVQLLAPDGTVLSQDDGQPGRLGAPSSQWIPGEIIVDDHRLNFRGAPPSGGMPIMVGLYHPVTGRRLVPEGDGTITDGLVEVLQIALETEP